MGVFGVGSNSLWSVLPPFISMTPLQAKESRLLCEDHRFLTQAETNIGSHRA